MKICFSKTTMEWEYPEELFDGNFCEKLVSILQNPRATIGEMRIILKSLGFEENVSSKTEAANTLIQLLRENVPRRILGEAWVGKIPDSPEKITLFGPRDRIGYLFDISKKGLLDHLLELKESEEEKDIENARLKLELKKAHSQIAKLEIENEKYANSFQEEYEKGEKLFEEKEKLAGINKRQRQIIREAQEFIDKISKSMLDD